LASKSDLANKQDKLSAGPNIDITNNVVSGKDWQSEIDAAVDAVATGFIPYSATNIPAGSSISVFGDNMLLVGKNITGIAYGNLAVGENIYKTAPNGLMAGSGINGSQNDILVGNGVSVGNNVFVLGDSISSNAFSLIIGGPSITGQYGESNIVAGNNNLTGMGNNNVVLGHANTATSGTDNVIIGRGNSTTGSENIVIGIDNSSNSGTIFGGIHNQVDNFGYIYGGSYNTATNAAGVLNGDSCYASGTGSVAGGLGTSALGDHQTVFGRYNSPNTGDIFQIGAGNVSDIKNAFVVSPSSDSISSNNEFHVDGNGNILSYPTTVNSYINEPTVKVRTQLIPIEFISENNLPPSSYITYQNISVDKNIALPKFYNNAIAVDDYNNCYIENYETYYNLSDKNIADYAHSVAPFTHQASNIERENAFDIFQKTKERGNLIYPPKNYFTIIPEKECGLYKIEFSLAIKGGYKYNSSDKSYASCEITPKFSGITLDRNYSYNDIYQGFGNADSVINRYNFSVYVSRTSTANNNTARVALTGLDFYASNMRWNPSDTYSQVISWNMRRTKVREYEGSTFVSNNNVDIQIEMD
jgi:hypothetical protein